MVCGLTGRRGGPVVGGLTGPRTGLVTVYLCQTAALKRLTRAGACRGQRDFTIFAPGNTMDRLQVVRSAPNE
mgnify:CR=1 FL=1